MKSLKNLREKAVELSRNEMVNLLGGGPCGDLYEYYCTVIVGSTIYSGWACGVGPASVEAKVKALAVADDVTCR